MYNTGNSIKMWAEDDRPREKLALRGKKALTDAELLGIVLGSGTRRKSAVDLAQDILNFSDNNLYKLGKLNQEELMRFQGIGEAKSLTIMAVLELGRRRAQTEIPPPLQLNTARDIYMYAKYDFQDLEHEEFRILALARNNKVLKNILLSVGGRASTIVDGKMVFKELIDCKASSGVLMHNHPSGNLKPSNADIVLTKRMIDFGRMIELPILDHLIFTDNGYYSLSENKDI